MCAPAAPSLRARSSQAVVVGAPAADQKEKVIRRVVGVHAVRNCVAEELDVLFWETVRHLKKRCDVRTVAGVCDGASVNRLFQKMNSSGQGRGTPNQFVTVCTHCPSLASPDYRLTQTTTTCEPFATRHSPLTARRSTLAPHRSPLTLTLATTATTPLTTHRLSLTAHRSPLPTTATATTDERAQRLGARA